MLELIWLIPLLPIVGVAINGLFGNRMSRRAVGLVACGVVAASFLVSLGAVLELAELPEHARFSETEVLGTWLPMGPLADGGEALRVSWGFALDALSAVMVLVVTGVGFLIHVYATGYMEHEDGFARFFVYMNLFMAMMLTLVLGNNMLVTFVGWEGVGLCSYLLIGFFYDRPFDERTGLSCADAGRKAFIVNRIGDFFFIVGMLFLAVTYGTLNYRPLLEAIAGAGPASHGMLVTVGILLFLGACGKSAQIPLYVWLPDAMAGPTPVSALIHAATMVTAGVYMVTRMSGLYAHAPEAMFLVACVGAGTAMFAALMGIAATDIKKVLAYSTVSQLGFMFAAAGTGAYVAAIFHLMTHAFFKALLFLGAGSVIHGLHGEQDITRMGGLKEKMPVTFRTFLIGAIAIAGIVPFAGFFSKDEILWGAWSSGNRAVWAVLAMTAGITAFYMFRLVFLTFYGTFRGDRHAWDHAHESPKSMTVPLMVLALLSFVGGWIGIPKALTGVDVNVFHHWLGPAVVAPHAAEGAHHSTLLELSLMGAALAIAGAGIGFAWHVYRRSEGLADALAKGFGPAYTLVRNLFWVDELYEAWILKPFYRVSRWFTGFDKWVVDGLVNASGIVTEITGQIVKLFQTGYVRNYALAILIGAIAVVYFFVTL
ncbi:MAG TPA: NADH-quinone oxidoreductase subunit L [Candidatus Polarisedimenticolaceae bacterium]